MIAGPVSGLAGIAGTLLPGPEGQGARFTEKVGQALTYEPKTEVGQRTSAAVAKPFEALDRFATEVGYRSGKPTDTLGATAVKTAIEALPMLFGIRGGRGAMTRAPERVPTTAELGARSSQAYQQAENAGVIIGKDSLKNAVADIKNTVAHEGIDKDLHPAALAVVRRLTEAADADMPISLKGAEILRRVMNDAAGSANKADRRIARIIRDKWDNYIEGLGPSDVLGGDAKGAGESLQSARSLYTRKRKGEAIESMIEKAKNRAAQFSGSGYENALRTEFRKLAQNDRGMRMFNPKEQAAIRRVARGGPIENSLRMMGKYAATNPVSTAIGSGIGAAVGGPIGAAVVPVAGGIARAGATALTKRNAALASELMRRGGPREAGATLGARKRLLATALAQPEQQR
jgi:hypothetical protein